MMLNQDDLTKALKDGQGLANVCGHWCRLGATIENGTYEIFHNHIGSDKTDVQRVHATAVLAKNSEQLAAKIGTWISGLHKGERIDLNAMEINTRGPALAGWPWRVGERFWCWADGSAP